MTALFEIVRYAPQYEDALMELIRQEGEDWKLYREGSIYLL